MTIAELIKWLSQYDPSTTVVVKPHDAHSRDIVDVTPHPDFDEHVVLMLSDYCAFPA